MIKIKNASIYNLYTGDGWPALGLKLWLSNSRTVLTQIPLTQTKSDWGKMEKLFQLYQEKLTAQVEPFLIDLELNEDGAITVDKWLKDLDDGALALAVSVAVNRACAEVNNQELYQQFNRAYDFVEDVFALPTPIFNLYNGGRHADTNLDFEEFLLVPISKNQSSFSQKTAAAAQIFQVLAEQLRLAGCDTDLGSFGGYAPEMTSSIQAIELMMTACETAGYNWGEDFGLGLDIGANWLSAGHGKYLFKLDHSQLQSINLVQLYEEWQSRYNLVYLEDPLASADISGWKNLSGADDYKLILAGDELFANNENKFRQNLKNHLGNAIVITPLALTTISEAVVLIKLAHEHNYKIVLSHGDQETNDDWLADLAVASQADFIKSGAVARGERNGKLNRLIEIEQDLSN